jgi:hypothetical protein
MDLALLDLSAAISNELGSVERHLALSFLHIY